MTDLVASASNHLLAPTGLDDSDLDRVLGDLMVPGVDYADLYFQYSRHETWALEEGTVKSGSFGIDQGVGVRAVSGEKTGFAYSDEIRLKALANAADAARSIARSGQDQTPVAVSVQKNSAPALYLPDSPFESLDDADKVALLKNVESAARRMDPRVSQVMVSLAGVHDIVLVARADGTLAADIRPLVRMNVTVLAEQNGRREQGSSGGGGRFSYSYFTEQDKAMEFAEEAVRQALVNLESREAPAGEMTVVLGPGWPGILLHEATGHGLEGDFNRKGTSAFSGRIGEKVAAES